MTRATVRRRIIPARAGFTGHHGAGSAPRKDHPRSRGVYAVSPVSWAAWTGSSPLARGLHPGARLPGAPQGIIPARAGFTILSFLSRVPASDHPRSRGVYPAASPRGRPRPGSSPLARGLLNPVGLTTNYFRIIPARAGFTPTPRRLTTPSPGSSPLARGLLKVDRRCGSISGIIPARAGFTRPRPSRTGHCRDHPRSRGVYGFRRPGRTEMIGSSPLARGLRCDCLGVGVSAGIIPARAGFTRSTLPTLRPRPDHPRSRGVYPRFSHPSFPRSGSSPLARGLHLCSASLLSL